MKQAIREMWSAHSEQSAAGCPSELLRPVPIVRDDFKDGHRTRSRPAEHRHDWRMQHARRRCPPLPREAAGRPIPMSAIKAVTAKPGVPSRAAVEKVPPLAVALQEAGLGHLARALVEGMACSTVLQLLSLTPTQLDTMLDQMRLLPGRRQALLTFIGSQRTRLAASDAATELAAGTSLEQRQWNSDWRMTREALKIAARQRERSCEYGPGADITAGPHLNWGRARGTPKVKRPSSGATVSQVRVLTFGRSRIVDHDGRLHAWS